MGDSRQICLEGEGVGRFKGFDENYRFNFTSEIEDQTWLMGLRFPLHGEEVLELDLNKMRKNFTGDFYLRIKDASRNYLLKNKKRYTNRDFDLFMQDMALLVKQIVSKGDYLKKCEMSKSFSCDVIIADKTFKTTKSERGISFTRELSKNFIFELNAFELEKNYYNKVIVNLIDNAANGNDQMIKLELTLNHCFRP